MLERIRGEEKDDKDAEMEEGKEDNVTKKYKEKREREKRK